MWVADCYLHISVHKYVEWAQRVKKGHAVYYRYVFFKNTSRSASQEIPRLLWYTKVHYRSTRAGPRLCVSCSYTLGFLVKDSELRTLTRRCRMPVTSRRPSTLAARILHPQIEDALCRGDRDKVI